MNLVALYMGICRFDSPEFYNAVASIKVKYPFNYTRWYCLSSRGVYDEGETSVICTAVVK